MNKIRLMSPFSRICYLYALSAGGQPGVEAILRIMHAEIKRGMTLMGCRSVKEITRDKVIFRKK